mmetsp:Transcript_39659/g.77096  ORF Transcript_39659/g.77096 Transcript_39659/m.77096 type:complete len:87 (+) Transcript_39659:1137-1397(+)
MQQRVIVSTLPHIYYQEQMDQGCACFVFHPDSPVIGLLAYMSTVKDSEKKSRGDDELKSPSEAKSSCGATSSTVVELITYPPKQSV